MTETSQFPAFAERLRTTLPQAITAAFGGAGRASSATKGLLPALVAALGGGQHVHLELELAGRPRRATLLLLLRVDDATALFGLEPLATPLPSDAEAQLRVLSELTDGGEALAQAFGPLLAAALPGTTLTVAGASLEDNEHSTDAAGGLLGEESAAFRVDIERPGGGMLPVIVACDEDLASLIEHDGVEAGASGNSAGERAAALAARAAARRGDPIDTAVSRPSNPAPVPALAGVAAAAPVTAHPFAFGQLDPGPQTASGPSRNIDPLLDVVLQVRVELGSTEMTVEEVLGLTAGSVVELDRLAGEPVDIVVNNRLLARGEVVVVEENFGVRLTEIISARAPRVVRG